MVNGACSVKLRYMAKDSNNIQTAEIVLACSELDQTLTFFVETLQFQIDSIFPADAPVVAILSGYGGPNTAMEEAKIIFAYGILSSLLD